MLDQDGNALAVAVRDRIGQAFEVTKLALQRMGIRTPTRPKGTASIYQLAQFIVIFVFAVLKKAEDQLA